ncbi:PepSY domain-containing protein [Streptomyces sp. TP-A0356]|uniref:PepSY domain-containing protein n=1 Tax=Streptomyces sp. TP-A0356 TaxID=1359208 RepID=UPI0006E336B6|nr:PepSY domain-containing protein [Streptomyces sp. TP-A0356]
MSQPVPPEHPESTQARKLFWRRLPRLGRSRVVAVGAAVVLLGGAAVGAAALAEHHHEGRGGHDRVAAEQDRRGGDETRGGDTRDGDEGRFRGHGNGRGTDGGQDDKSQAAQGTQGTQGAQGTQGNLAPAPVPAVAADKAVQAATKAVPGGKADALRVVGQQGGGSAWEVEVLGTDGVRHLVTIDGASGSVTGNTVAPTSGSNGG